MSAADRRSELERLAQDLVYKELRPDKAVSLASTLVAEGEDGPATVALASQPASLRLLDLEEVAPQVRAMLDELDVALPSPSAAGWAAARSIAESMLHGSVRRQMERSGSGGCGTSAGGERVTRSRTCCNMFKTYSHCVLGADRDAAALIDSDAPPAARPRPGSSI